MLTRRFITATATAAVLAAGGLGVWWSQRPGALASAGSSNPQSEIRPPQPPPLHPVVSQIVHDSAALPYLKLNYIIKEIPTDLAVHDIDALLTFITGPQPGKFSLGEWGSLTNDIQEALSVQKVPNEKVARTLIATFRDENRPQLMRDYALQHVGGFAIYLVHTAHTRKGKLPAFFNDLTAELLTAAQDSSKPWCGTAFNLLGGILRAAEYRTMEIPGVNAETLTALALSAAKDTTAPLNARLPALQLAARHKSPDAAALAREILNDRESPLMLVQSAAAVLATTGTGEDLALLQTLRSKNIPHTREALDTAIRQISKR
ncbi:MAG: hypothetical protein V4733_06055 [Verrucomicrobiota bacterium]